MLVLPFFYSYYYPGTLIYNMRSDANLYNCESLLNNLDARSKFEGLYVMAWEGVGKEGIPYLMELLEDPCYAMRYFAVKSLGKIASNQPDVIDALKNMTSDSSNLVAETAKHALKRISLVQTAGRRIHVTIDNVQLLSAPWKDSPVIKTVPAGTEFVGLKWRIPGRYLSYYDYVKILPSGETGFFYRYPYGAQTYMI